MMGTLENHIRRSGGYEVYKSGLRPMLDTVIMNKGVVRTDWRPQ
jgi:hypothetical protein